jgi:Concanavalin A-like lectin/glucanases superfamily/Secretion system C-terminal sorting domain
MRKITLVMLATFAMYTLKAQIPASGLIGHWPFDGDANDYSGNNNNGIINNANLTNDRFGNLNKAYAFNGTNSIITVPDAPGIALPNGQSFSVSLWMKTNANAGYSCFISKHIAGTWNGFGLTISNIDPGYCTSAGHLTSYVASAAFEDACSDNAIAFDTANWHHIISIYDAAANQTLLYIDTVLQVDTGRKSGYTNNNADLRFGAFPIPSSSIYSNYSSYYNGALDDIRLYDRTLSPSEVVSLFKLSNASESSLGTTKIKNDMFSLYPNPASNIVRLRLNNIHFKYESATLKITSADGRLLKEQTIYDKKSDDCIISISDLSSGFYNLSIQTENGFQNTKFVKE